MSHQSDAASAPVRAFVSWAHDDPAGKRPWREAVLRFTFALRVVGGIDAEIDAFYEGRSVVWSTFGVTAIDDADFVLVVTNSVYKERWERRGDRTVGAGVAREAGRLRAIFDRDQDEFFNKVKVILLPGVKVTDTPGELGSDVQRFKIDSFDLSGLTELLRVLTGQALLEKPPVGIVPALPRELLEGVRAENLSSVSDPGDQGQNAIDPTTGGVLELRVRIRRNAPILNNPGGAAQGDVERQQEALRAITGALGAPALTHLAASRHTAAVNDLAFSPDGRLLVSVSDDTTARIWDVARGELRGACPHEVRVHRVRFSPDGRTFATAARGTVTVWDASSGERRYQWTDAAIVTGLAYGPGGVIAATSARAGDATPAVRLWSGDTGQPLESPCPRPMIYDVALADSSRGVLVATSSSSVDRAIVVSILGSKAPPFRELIPSGDRRTNYVALGPQGEVLLASYDDYAAIWEVETVREHPIEHRGNVPKPVLSGDGEFVATLKSSNEASVWCARTRAHLGDFGTDADISDIAFSADARLVAVAGTDAVARIYSIRDKQQIDAVAAGDLIKRVAFDPTGTLFATGGLDGMARIWSWSDRPFADST